MKRILNWLFPEKPKEVEAEPKPGEIWIFSGNKSNPFTEEGHKVEVLAVKGGWVNYRWLDTTMFQNESMVLHSFNYCYKPFK